MKNNPFDSYTPNNLKNMKRFIALAFVGVFSMLLSSCENIDEQMIIGSWNIDKSITKPYEQEEVVITNMGVLTFDSNNTGSFVLYGNQPGYGSFSWRVSGNSLIISEFNEYFDGTYKVVTSTSNELIIERSLFLVVQTFELSAI